jgi:hypothetical protein
VYYQCGAGFTWGDRVVNINKTIRELIEEKKRLDRVIGTLEEMQRNGPVEVAAPPKKRGRKSMDEQARQEVSARMKRYWESRRKQESVIEPGREQTEA